MRDRMAAVCASFPLPLLSWRKCCTAAPKEGGERCKPEAPQPTFPSPALFLLLGNSKKSHFLSPLSFSPPFHIVVMEDTFLLLLFLHIQSPSSFQPLPEPHSSSSPFASPSRMTVPFSPLVAAAAVSSPLTTAGIGFTVFIQRKRCLCGSHFCAENFFICCFPKRIQRFFRLS